MNLVVPTVGVDPGPDWANNLNADLSILDGHNHSSGSGVQVTPSGLNINTDLTINQNNLTSARSIRFFPQTANLALPADIGVLYEVTPDLWYNDANGNQIRITQNGAVSGTPGSIANLVSPASASYVSASSTFVFQSGANVPASIDGGSFIFRNITANSPGVTLSPIAGLASSYSLVLPLLPSAKAVMTLDQSGNMGTALLDGSTLQFVGGVLEVPTGGITGTQIAANTVQQSNLYVRAVQNPATAGNLAAQSISGSFAGGSATLANITISTTGRPVSVGLKNGNGSGQITMTATYMSGQSASTVAFATVTISGSNGFTGTTVIRIPSNNDLTGTFTSTATLFDFLDTTGSTGSVVYTLTVDPQTIGPGVVSPLLIFINQLFIAYEL